MRIGCQVTRRPAPTSWYSKMVTIDLSGQSALVTGGRRGLLAVKKTTDYAVDDETPKRVITESQTQRDSP